MPLRALTELDKDQPVNGTITSENNDAQEDPVNAICSNPCIPWYNYKICCYLLTYFSKQVFSYDICQPNNNPDSLTAMESEIAGRPC